MTDFYTAQLQTDATIARLAAQSEKAIIREYATALKTIRSDLAVAYEKYSVGSELTYAEMSKYNRLANLESQMFREINRVTGSTSLKLKNAVGNVYQETYYRTAFNVERDLQAKLGFGMLNPNTIQKAIDNPFTKHGAGLQKDTLGFLLSNSRNNEVLKSQLRSTLTQGLVQGKGYSEVARDLKKRLDIGAANAKRIAQTEMHRSHMQGRRDSLEHARAMGVEMDYQWVATMDERTRDTHQEMDGELTNKNHKFEFQGREVDGPGMTGIASEDIRCRCSMVGVIKGYESKVRRTRDAGIIPWTTYKPYAKAKGWPVKYTGPEARVAVPSFSSLESKAVQYDKYETFMKENISELRESGVRSRVQVEAIWKDAHYKNSALNYRELTRQEAVRLIGEKVPRSILHGWFREFDSSYKPALERLVITNPELRNAGMNIAYQNYLAETGTRITFEQFTKKAVNVYRGGNFNFIADDVFVSFSYSKDVAARFGANVVTRRVIPGQTLGAFQTTGESEILIPWKLLSGL